MLNEYSTDGEIATITLNKGYSAKVFVSDLPLISSLRWRVAVQKRSIYVLAKKRISFGVFKTVLMHRLIMDAPYGTQVDHKDGDGLNNLSSNLRLVTRSQNQMNMRKHKNKVSLKGASYHKDKGRWSASISVNRKAIYLGYFDNEIDAHKAYCEASKKYHGDFGRTI